MGGVIILALTLFVFLEIFYQLLNDDIHWWFVLVGVVLAATLVVASAFIIVFFTKDDEPSRGKLFTACLLVIIGLPSRPSGLPATSCSSTRRIPLSLVTMVLV